MLFSAEKDVFTFISPGFGRSLVWLFSLFHAVSGHDRSSFHSLLLVSFPISRSVLGHACICSTQSNKAGDHVPRVGLQTASAEEEISCTSCLCLQRFRVSLHQRRAHSCTMESSLLLCILVSTSEVEPTTNIWPTSNLLTSNFNIVCSHVLV